jgi:replication-associated recombination protein RarA
MADGALEQAAKGNWKTERKKAGYQNQQSGSDNPTTVFGYDKGEVISALQKAIRRGHEAEALYWAHELLDSNETYRMWRRLVVIAAEDVGLADPDMTAKIMTMKQAHDFGRESNILFQAVMMLCRAPKNREADDASYLYFLRRKKGWRIPIPPEAVDGHTRRGRSQLYRMAEQSQTTWEDMWNREFYFDVALLDKYVEVETAGVAELYRRELMKQVGLPFNTYDIATSKQPRIRTGNNPISRSVLEGGVSTTGGVEVRTTADENGEVQENVLKIQSFTDPSI